MILTFYTRTVIILFSVKVPIKSYAKRSILISNFCLVSSPTFSMGIGMVHDLLDITSCLREANLLLDAAASLNINILEYSSDSFFQLILLLKESPELYRYYSSFLEKLNAFDSENGNILFLTVKEFVICKGSYSDVAAHMNQHENTIRYRINKVRQLFNMEDDLISFYNTISVLSAIDALV